MYNIHAKKDQERVDHANTIDLNLCRNTMKYRNTHKIRDVIEIKLHFINKKYLKYSYRHNGNKLARVLVAYL